MQILFFLVLDIDSCNLSYCESLVQNSSTLGNYRIPKATVGTGASCVPRWSWTMRLSLVVRTVSWPQYLWWIPLGIRLLIWPKWGFVRLCPQETEKNTAGLYSLASLTQNSHKAILYTLGDAVAAYRLRFSKIYRASCPLDVVLGARQYVPVSK